MTTRVIPPSTGFIGRGVGNNTFTGSAYYDVSDQDAAILTANGFVVFGYGHLGRSGPTSERPRPGAGSFTDTTLGEVVTWVPTAPTDWIARASGNGTTANSLAGFWANYQGENV